MPTETTSPIVYRTLNDIRERKKVLRNELRQDGKQMRVQWNGLFVKPDDKPLPARRLTRMVSTSVTVFDGLIFALKLYNRLSGGKQGRRKLKKSKGKNIISLLFR